MSNDSNIVVGDSLNREGMPSRVIRFVNSTELAQRGMSADGSFDYQAEAEKVFVFLQQWISCKTYDAIFRLMADDSSDSCLCKRVGGVCMADLYDGHDSIHELERTIHVLESVKEVLISNRTRAMVENEIELLRNKVYSLADDDTADEDTGEFV